MFKDSTGVLKKNQIVEIHGNTMRDPFSLLGMHPTTKGLSVVTVQHGAVAVTVVDETGKKLVELAQIEGTGIFSGLIARRKKIVPYKLIINYADGFTRTTEDPYSFLPIISEEDLYLFNQGNNNQVYRHLGSHLTTVNGVEGTHFAVWAPSAQRVSVVGNFNLWDGRAHPMRVLGSSGVWELFIPAIAEGEVYKFEIKKAGSGHLVLKTDPYGYQQEPYPNHGTVVRSLSHHEWTDDKWLAKRKKTDWVNSPMSIYELHLGSWRKDHGDEEWGYFDYRRIAHELVEYILDMGYTHVELMPVQEHPYVPSWGYQVGGFYAVNHRFGNPEDFQYFVDYLHQHNIGVILDWVPGHFPKDEHILAHFDGTHLYEHSDPREGEHKDWGTLIFNYGRHEVRNFLVSNAMYWIEQFHIDGLRIDAVASMLYRNYSREEGEWIPNQYGGCENLEAMEFLKQVNGVMQLNHPGVVTIAEESTSFPKVSWPLEDGGLGFTFKWNMGWMHDTLEYFEIDSLYRKYHTGTLTFSLMYAFTERFMLVLSHDEVVHGKKSLLEKMPGDDWQKFANLRSLYAMMMGHPGKKLLFQGGEFGQRSEWYEKRAIDWELLDTNINGTYHAALKDMVKDLNHLYQRESALWEDDFTPAGFDWVDYNDIDASVFSYIRKTKKGDNDLLFVCHFTPELRSGYRLGLPFAGTIEEIFNSNAQQYGGEGTGNPGNRSVEKIEAQGKEHSIMLDIAPLSVSIFRITREN